MANYVTLRTLSDNLTTNLNAISTTLYGNSEIERAIPFNITNDIQDYEEEKTFSSSVIIPGIMTRLDGSIAPTQNHQLYTDVVSITIYAFARELDDTMRVIDEYMETYTGYLTSSSTWTYHQEFTRPSVIDRGKDDGEDRVTIIFDITYTFIANAYISSDVTFTINSVAVPVLTYDNQLTREAKSMDTQASPGIIKHRPIKSDVQRTVRFIMLNNVELLKVLEDIDTGGNLTRTYTVFFGLGYDGTSTYDYSSTTTMSIIGGKIEYAEGGYIIVTATFGTYWS